MRRLRQRHPSDRLVNEVRTQRVRWTKWVYLVIVAGFFLWLGNLLVGPFLYLKASGIVLADKTTLSTEFLATVTRLYVSDYSEVSRSQRVAGVASHQFAAAMSQLTAKVAELRLRVGELETRRATIAALIPIAVERAAIAEDVRQQLDILQDRKILPIDKRVPTFEAFFRSRQELQSLQAESRAIDERISELRAVVSRSEAALAELEKSFSGGGIFSPADGIVSQLYVAEGTVIRPGEPLMDIYSGEPYVLAYLPISAIFDVLPGDAVAVRHGLAAVRGYIARIEPVAAALPREFQKIFKPVERGQVMRILFADGIVPPPLFSTVDVLSANGPWDWIVERWQTPANRIAGQK